MTEEDMQPNEMYVIRQQEIHGILHKLMLEYRQGADNTGDMIQAMCLIAQENAALRVAVELGIKLV